MSYYAEVGRIPESQRGPASSFDAVARHDLLLMWRCLGHVIVCDRARVRVSNNVKFHVTPGAPAPDNAADYSRQSNMQSLDKDLMSWDRGKVVIQDKATFSSNSFSFLNFTAFESEQVRSILDKDLAMRHNELFQRSFSQWVL